MKTNKMKLALTGPTTSPKLFTALQLAYGLTGDWRRIIVIGSSSNIGQYQHLGGYNTLGIAKDATPSRYRELTDIATSCGKDVVILSNLTDEWQYGVLQHVNSSYYADALCSHRTLLLALKHAPVHVIGCIDTRTTFLQKDGEGRHKLRQEQPIQQQDFATHFTTVLNLDKRGGARVEKDGTGIFQKDEPFKVGLHHGALLSDWCRGGDPVISLELQHRIDRCTSLSELYQILFETDVDDADVMTAFTRRRLQLDEERKKATFEIVPGALL
ncbi:hypothetical protein HRG84_17730 [Flavisolibacter sp. BT320]|nr:hypothetical protein [Flavisolibacter longurius]